MRQAILTAIPRPSKKLIRNLVVISVAGLISLFILILLYRVYAGMKTKKYIEALGDKNPAAQNEAVAKLGKMKDKRRKVNKLSGVIFSTDNSEVVNKLGEFSGSGNDDIRMSMVMAIGRMEGMESTPVLIKALKDRNPDIRMKAVEALGKTKDPAAVPALVELLKDKDMAIQAIWALGSIGDNSAVPAIIPLLDDKDQYVKFQAYQALEKIKNNQDD
ncbi:MAG: HEAT repeat domain-containing protein [Deltaproteobacteria bacterium]|nr:HEAT repeat domain-containing protein [Deltaproteobacteria bacterium]